MRVATGPASPRQAVTLEVRGRVSRRTIAFPLVVADHEGRCHLVSVLGEDADWVGDVRAAQQPSHRRTPVARIRAEREP